MPIDLGVKWDIGAPMPHLLQSEFRTFLVFYLRANDPPRNGTDIIIADHTSPEPIGVVEWHTCDAAVLGAPNDEVIHGHRLWARGLNEIPYGAGEVLNSAWIAELDRVNSVHLLYNSEAYKSARHFILLFHDSTFECIADSYTVERRYMKMSDVLVELAAKLLPGSS